MAENPIRKEDIIDIEGLREELKGLIGDLTKLAELMKGDLKNSAAQFKEETAKIDVTTKEGRQQMKERLKDITDLTRQYNWQSLLCGSACCTYKYLGFSDPANWRWHGRFRELCWHQLVFCESFYQNRH